MVFGSPLIGKDEIDEVVDSLKSGWLGTGPKVTQFEQDFKKYKNCDYAVSVNSCTAALHLSLLAAEIRPGDEVITTAMTFCATVNAIIHAGATPVLADIDRKTLNIDPKDIERKITSRTRAIIPVHFAGYPCDMDSICSLAEKHHLQIIEDCAHAIESEYHGKKTGTFGGFGCFSFYVTKNVVTGEGGMIITGNEAAAARLKRLALHGLSSDAWKRYSDDGYKHYYVEEAGFKYNMMDIQAAIGIHQLKRIEENWHRRKTVWMTYNEAFRDLPVVLPNIPDSKIKHAYHLYPLLVDRSSSGIDRDTFLVEMTRRNIGVGVHYLSIPEHPYYQRTYGWRPEDFPVASEVGRSTVSLPLSAKLTDEDVDDVIEAVVDLIAGT